MPQIPLKQGFSTFPTSRPTHANMQPHKDPNSIMNTYYLLLLMLYTVPQCYLVMVASSPGPLWAHWTAVYHHHKAWWHYDIMGHCVMIWPSHGGCGDLNVYSLIISRVASLYASGSTFTLLNDSFSCRLASNLLNVSSEYKLTLPHCRQHWQLRFP